MQRRFIRKELMADTKLNGCMCAHPHGGLVNSIDGGEITWAFYPHNDLDERSLFTHHMV